MQRRKPQRVGDIHAMSRGFCNDFFQQKWFWVMTMVLLLMLYAGLIILALMPAYSVVSLVLLSSIFIIHLFELKAAMRIGKEKGFPKGHSVVMDLLFGFVWWLPVKRGVWQAGTD